MNSEINKIMPRNEPFVLRVVFFVIILCASIVMANTTKLQPLGEAEIRAVISKLNNYGIVLGFDANAKKNEVFGYSKEHGSFGIANTEAGWYLYKTDINNDREDEYVLTSSQGSGCFFDIEAIYKDKNGKPSDIYEEIKIPIRKLIRDSQKASYDIEEGYSGFMNGGIDIESIDGKIFFTLQQVTRDYNINDYDKSFQKPELWKFLWDDNKLKLIVSETKPSS